MSDFRALWIRKDREEYFLGGVIVACAIASFISVYWHFSDRVPLKELARDREKPFQGSRPSPKRSSGFSPYLHSGATGRTTAFYRLSEDTVPRVPAPAFNIEP